MDRGDRTGQPQWRDADQLLDRRKFEDRSVCRCRRHILKTATGRTAINKLRNRGMIRVTLGFRCRRSNFCRRFLLRFLLRMMLATTENRFSRLDATTWNPSEYEGMDSHRQQRDQGDWTADRMHDTSILRQPNSRTSSQFWGVVSKHYAVARNCSAFFREIRSRCPCDSADSRSFRSADSK